MTDTSTQTDHQDPASPAEQKPAEKTFTQADVDKIVGERLARQKEQHYGDYEELQTAAAELQKIKEAGKSEQQKLADQLTALQQQIADKDAEIATATLTSLKATVAADKGVPAGSLTGSTKEELEASADQLIAWRDAAKPPTRKPPAPTGLKSGASNSGDTSANPMERAAAAMRAMRQGG